MLMRRIESWAIVQASYIPFVASLRVKNPLDSENINKPECFPLFLPSALRRHIPCDTKLQEIEWKLRIGQAHDALEELRQALRTRAYMERFKDRFLRGQGANTRARNSLKAVDAKVDSSAIKYHIAYAALLELSTLLGKTGWNNGLRSLEKDDIRPMTAGAEHRSSEGRRRLSWIWLVCGYDGRTAENEGDLDGVSYYPSSTVSD